MNGMHKYVHMYTCVSVKDYLITFDIFQFEGCLCMCLISRYQCERN
jgi:hypothetical protein